MSVQVGLYLWTKRKHSACSITPTTCKLIKRFSAASTCQKCTSKFVQLGGGTQVLSNAGPTNTRLRAYLGLVVGTGEEGVRMLVGGKEVTLEEGKVVVVDESFEHEMENRGKGKSLLLAVDFHHPDLSDESKKNSSFTQWIKNSWWTK